MYRIEILSRNGGYRYYAETRSQSTAEDICTALYSYLPASSFRAVCCRTGRVIWASGYAGLDNDDFPTTNLKFRRKTFDSTDPKDLKQSGLVSHDGIWSIDKRTRGEYQLTHIPTGRGVGPWMKLAQAREFADRLSQISDDWDRDYADIKRDRELGRQESATILEFLG